MATERLRMASKLYCHSGIAISTLDPALEKALKRVITKQHPSYELINL